MDISNDELMQGDSDEPRGDSGGMSWWIKFTIFVLGMVMVMAIIWVYSLGDI